ncbi:phage tail assembly protein [Acidisoma sp. 7E03]
MDDEQVIDIPLTDDQADSQAKPKEEPGVVVLPATDDDAETLPKNAKELEDGSVVLTLRHPRTLKFREGAGPVREEHYEQLTFRRLTGADMRIIMNASKNSSTIAIARSIGMRPLLFDRLHDMMDGSDVTACAQVISYFLDSGKPTGQ